MAMGGEFSLDPARLENVKCHADGSIHAACPACRAVGSDKSGDHLLIQPDGKFGCATNPRDGEHRKEIFKLAGVRLAPKQSAPRPAITAAPSAKPVATAHEIFDWQACVCAFTDAKTQWLVDWRGLSPEFVRWLHAQGMVGFFEGKLAFANHGDGGAVVAAHVRLDNGKWIYKPAGQKTVPLIFGDLKSAGFVMVFESQWDAFAVMDKFGWHAANGLPDIAVFITRGAGNGKLIRGQVSPDAVCYVFKQNDQPTPQKPIPAGDVWLAEIIASAGCKVLNVATPAPHKDANDWTRAGATKADLEAALTAAKICQPPGSLPETAQVQTVTTANDVRGEILEILTNGKLTTTEQRTQIAASVVTALTARGQFFFHAERHDFESAMFFDNERKRLERIKSDAFIAWLSDWLRVNRADTLFRFIAAEVETVALSGKQTTGIIPESFWAARPGAIYISTSDGQAAKITAGKVEIVDNGTDGILFTAGRTLAPWTLTTPADPFETCSLFAGANCAATHEASKTLTRRPATYRQAADSRARHQRGCVPVCAG